MSAHFTAFRRSALTRTPLWNPLIATDELIVGMLRFVEEGCGAVGLADCQCGVFGGCRMHFRTGSALWVVIVREMLLIAGNLAVATTKRTPTTLVVTYRKCNKCTKEASNRRRVKSIKIVEKDGKKKKLNFTQNTDRLTGNILLLQLMHAAITYLHMYIWILWFRCVYKYTNAPCRKFNLEIINFCCSRFIWDFWKSCWYSCCLCNNRVETNGELGAQKFAEDTCWIFKGIRLIISPVKKQAPNEKFMNLKWIFNDLERINICERSQIKLCKSLILIQANFLYLKYCILKGVHL